MHSPLLLDSPEFSPTFTISQWECKSNPQSPHWAPDPVRILKACQKVWKSQDACDTNAFITAPDNKKLWQRVERANAQLESCKNQSPSDMVQGLNSCLTEMHRAVDDHGKVNVSILDDIVCQYFRQIPFHDWVEAAVGCRSEVVDSLLMSIALLRLRVLDATIPERTNVPDFGSRPRSNLHPLTNGAIGGATSPDLPVEMLDFILDPIRTTIAGANRQHSFLRLMVLSVRFEETYISPKFVDWSNIMSEDFSFCEGVASRHPEQLAREVTEADVECFDQTTIGDLCTETLNACDERWYWLSRQAYECAIISSSLTESIYKLANKLSKIRNYHSMTALIAGVKAALSSRPTSPTEHHLQDYYRLLEPHNNYEYCRSRSIGQEALPWLAPFRQHLLAAKYTNQRPEVISSSANLLLQIMAYSNRVHETSSALHNRRSIVLLGDSGVGKSCWISRLRLNEFLEGDDPTIEDTHLLSSNTAFGPHIAQVLDCGGADTLPAMLSRWIALGEAYILAYSMVSRASFARVLKIYYTICELHRDGQEVPPVLLLGCKSDLPSRARVSGKEGYILAKQYGWLFAETSAKAGYLDRSRDMVEVLLTRVLERRRRRRRSVDARNFLSLEGADCR